MLRRSLGHFARSLTILNVSAATLIVPVAAVLLCGNNVSHAQGALTSPVQSSVVLDFDVATGLDPVLGRRAADAVAVEMKSSGDFDVVQRQRVEELVATIPGLRPPYTPSTARRLGEVAGAQLIITGRILSAVVTRAANNVRTARVEIEIREMDARTGDYVNGAQPSTITVDSFEELDDDVLMDQSLDKAAYNGVRQMRLYVPAEATVTHNLNNNVEFNRGLREGVRVGQRFSILRDHFNTARRIVERVKVAEVRIIRVDTYQSSAVIVDGGAVGVRTGDKARRVFAAGIPFTEPTERAMSKSEIKKSNKKYNNNNNG